MNQPQALIIEVPSEEAMHQLGINLGRLLEPGEVVSLNGPLGAGKTTLTKGIGEGVGVTENISSPTFLISRTHTTSSGTIFNHIDAYRLSSATELDDLDIDFEKSISVIEWGKGFAQGLVDSILEINIERDLATDLRTLSVSGTGRFSDANHFLGAR